MYRVSSYKMYCCTSEPIVMMIFAKVDQFSALVGLAHHNAIYQSKPDNSDLH